MLSPGERLGVAGRSGPVPFPAVVVRSDATGVWCTRLPTGGVAGGDERRPEGPCRGATRTVLVTGAGSTGTHTHTLSKERLPVRTRVLLLMAADGPWVLSVDGEVT